MDVDSYACYINASQLNATYKQEIAWNSQSDSYISEDYAC